MAHCFRQLLSSGVLFRINVGLVMLVTTAHSTVAAEACLAQENLHERVIRGTYQGTVGGTPIVMRIDEDPKFFYLSKGIDIDLDPYHHNNTLILREMRTDKKSKQKREYGCLTFAFPRSKPRHIIGTWKRDNHNNQQPQKIDIQLVQPEKLKTNKNLLETAELIKLKRDNPYDFLRINHVWKKSADHWSVQEPLSRVQFFRIKGASHYLNGALQDIQMWQVLEKLHCQANALEAGTDWDYEIKTSKLFANTKMVSFENKTYAFCGGMRPRYQTNSFILDRSTGEKIKASDIWEYVQKPKWDQLFFLHLSSKIKKECLDVLKNTKDRSYDFYLSRKGLHITPNFLPHVALACAEDSIVPFAQLKSLGTPRNPYYATIYK